MSDKSPIRSFLRTLGIGIVLITLLALVSFVVGLARDRQDTTNDTEEETVETPSVSQEELVTGSWRSSDDDKYTMTLNSDGTLVEHYDDEVVMTGAWNFFTDPQEEEGLPDNVDFPNDLYLKKVDSSGETFHYNISEVDENSLTLVYLFGDVLSFERIE